MRCHRYPLHVREHNPVALRCVVVDGSCESFGIGEWSNNAVMWARAGGSDGACKATGTLRWRDWFFAAYVGMVGEADADNLPPPTYHRIYQLEHSAQPDGLVHSAFIVLHDRTVQRRVRQRTLYSSGAYLISEPAHGTKGD